MKPPIAKQIAASDPYSWLRDKNWPKVEDQEILAYINAENSYCAEVTRNNQYAEAIFYEELKTRIKEDDESYPVQEDDYHYFTKVVKGKDYPILCRKKEKEETILDSNLLAEGKSSFALGGTAVSNDHAKLAYSFDADGSERFNIKVRNLSNVLDLEDEVLETLGGIVWNKNDTGFYYLKLSDNWRSDKVYFHLLGTKQQDDILIYHEVDSSFHLNIGETSSKDFLIINAGNGSNNEILYLSLHEEPKEPEIYIPRKADQLYEIDHIKGKFYMLTNDKGKNFRVVLMQDKEIKQEIVACSADYYLTDMSLYNDYLVVIKRILGINYIEVYNLSDYELDHKIKFEEEPYQASVIFTNKKDKFLRIAYSSLTTPRSVFEYEFQTKKMHLRKTEEILGFNRANYVTKRLWAEASDNVKIPISIVYHKDKLKNPNPMVLYGYGSYGSGVPVSFRPSIISLLDRGFIYAIAHIRGGDELGYHWYEDAKFLTKKRTFDDFIACTKYLIENNYTSSSKLAIMGGSAGGMLMGTVVNQAPELFKAVVAMVPFVDVLNTMLDETLPLTPGEFEEWGNPKNPEYYQYIKSYSPYDNVEKKEYPAMFVTAGLTDPRVGYWEAAKWVAKLRANKTDNNLLVLKTDMDAGHAGKSGRYKVLEEVAKIYSFIVSQIC